MLCQRGRKRYIKPAAAISSRIVFSPAPIQRELSISSEAHSWRVSEFDGLRFLQRRSFCSNRRLPVLRSAQFRQKSQNGFHPHSSSSLAYRCTALYSYAAAAIFLFLSVSFNSTTPRTPASTRSPVSLSTIFL